eukprot:5955062-Prymnesium_polylepis.4
MSIIASAYGVPSMEYRLDPITTPRSARITMRPSSPGPSNASRMKNSNVNVEQLGYTLSQSDPGECDASSVEHCGLRSNPSRTHRKTRKNQRLEQTSATEMSDEPLPSLTACCLAWRALK